MRGGVSQVLHVGIDAIAGGHPGRAVCCTCRSCVDLGLLAEAFQPAR
jgi:hypothetical protein